MSTQTELKAGRELDALIAEKVMGLSVGERDWPCGYVPDGCGLEVYEPRERQDWDDDDERFARSVASNESFRDSFLTQRHPVYIVAHENGWNERRVIPFYSTDIAAALTVAEHFREYSVHKFDSGMPPEETVPNLAKGYHVVIVASAEDLNGGVEAEADTAPLAICLAALAALKSVCVSGESPE